MNNPNTCSNNRIIARNFGREVAASAVAGGLISGPSGAIIGATLTAAQNVVFGLADHGPVNVPIPRVPMNPSNIENMKRNHHNSSDFTVPMNPSQYDHHHVRRAFGKR